MAEILIALPNSIAPFPDKSGLYNIIQYIEYMLYQSGVVNGRYVSEIWVVGAPALEQQDRMGVPGDPPVGFLCMWARWKAAFCRFPKSPHSYYCEGCVVRCGPWTTCKVRPSVSNVELSIAHQSAARLYRTVAAVFTSPAQVKREKTDKY